MLAITLIWCKGWPQVARDDNAIGDAIQMCDDLAGPQSSPCTSHAPEVLRMTNAITPRVAGHVALAPLASRLVDPDALPWQPTHFAGIEIKTLLFDRSSGLLSALMRMAPGAVLPDHEHVQIEQTWVLEGHLVDRSGPDDGIECKAGQFIWRPAGSQHNAWSPNGCLMLAFFQIPNKFLHADGPATDMAGNGWASMWGVVQASIKGTAVHARSTLTSTSAVTRAAFTVVAAQRIQSVVNPQRCAVHSAQRHPSPTASIKAPARPSRRTDMLAVAGSTA
jgi:quercetin dioxygenase-like cupin family protein